MKITNIKEFRDQATRLLRSKEPILITRRGKIAGFFLPTEGEDLPFDLRREMQTVLVEAIRRSLQERGLIEEDILADFEASRKARR